MNFDIARPWILLLIPVFVFYSLWMVRSKEGGWRKPLSVRLLRVLVGSTVLLALAGVQLQWNLHRTTNIFVVDVSDSSSFFKGEATKFIQASLEDLPSRNQSAVIAFGQQTVVEQFLSKDKYFEGFQTKVQSGATNIEQAITQAMSLFPQSQGKRIILISDGQENVGEGKKVIPSLLQQGIEVKVYKIDKPLLKEVYLDAISIPDSLHLGEKFEITANIKSNVATKATIQLINGREVKAKQDITIQKGDNTFVFQDTQQQRGIQDYKVIIEPAIDTEVRNNELSAFTNIEGAQRLLVVEGGPGEAKVLRQILNASGASYQVVGASAVPRNIKEMLEYKGMILANVHGDDLSPSFKQNIETYVRDYGGGVIATGGENAFALGNYQNTPLEKILPIQMEMKGKKEIPSMSIVLVIDHSGSMSGNSGPVSKLSLAKEAAVKALETFRPQDYLGVLTFDESYGWVVKPQLASDKEALREAIGKIALGGGTSIYPALEEAIHKQIKSPAKIKHIILLTDGQDGYKQYKPLLKQLDQNKITLSTVAVGSDADQALLKSLAEQGNGRSYYTDINSNIPRIFAKEIFMSARTYINNREFVPKIASNHPLLEGIPYEKGLPTLLGYIGASQKDVASVILTSDEEDPILTAWQYGLGRTIAWNSDISGKWSSHFVKWNDNLKLWQNMIRWMLEQYGDQGNYIETKNEGNSVKVSYHTTILEKNSKVKVVYSDEKGQRWETTLSATKPGIYENTIPLPHTGYYGLSVIQEKDGKVVSTKQGAVSLPYSPEYKTLEQSTLLEEMVEGTNGKFIFFPREVFQGKTVSESEITDFTTFFLLVAVFLWMLDIINRKLTIPWGALGQFGTIVGTYLTKIWRTRRPQRSLIQKKSENKEKLFRNQAKVSEPLNSKEAEKEENQNEQQRKPQKQKVSPKSKKAKENNTAGINTSALLNAKKKRDRY